MSDNPTSLRENTVSVKYSHSSLRLPILHLLEAEGKVTRNRLAEVLSVSRMTATRIAEQLLKEGYLAEVAGHDPISGRMSRLLRLSPEPPILLLDVWEESPYMTAYVCEHFHISSLSFEYRFTADTTGNKLFLAHTARTLCRLTAETICMELFHPPKHPDTPCTLPFSDHRTVKETDAIARALCHQPELLGHRTLLHLRASSAETGVLYVRQTSETPWFAPGGCHISDPSLFPASSDGLNALSSLLTQYCRFFQPDVILWEEAQAPVSAPSALGIKLAPLSPDHPLSEVLHSVAPHTELTVLKSKIPLWVTGAVAQLREERWLKHLDRD